MTNHTTALDLDDIETRAARLHEYGQQGDGEGDTLAGEDVPALLAEVRRLRAELADQRAETQKLIRWHGEDETALKKMRGTVERLRAKLAAPRTLTESEHNAAWHAIEGAAGEDMADPGTVLNAVLHALGITPPATPAVSGAADSRQP